MDRKARLNEILAKARALSAKVEGEGRDFDDTERSEVKSLFDEAKGHAEAIKARAGDDDTIKNLLGLGNGVDFGASRVEAQDLAGGPRGAKTLGEAFVDGTKDYFGSIAPNGGHIGEKTRVHSPAVGMGGVKALYGQGQKAIFSGSVNTGAGAAGAFTTADFRGLPDATGTFQRELPLLSAITIGQTGSDQVSYARITGFTNAAAPTAEATGTSGGVTGGDVAGTKPESAMVVVPITANVKTVAHWMPATKRALSDAGQLKTLIDAFLLYGLDEELEDQIINGNNTGENFEGILNVTGVQTQAWDTDLLTTTRKAITKVQVNGKADVTAFAVNPTEDERLDLTKDDTGRFYFGGPVTQGATSLWGRRRIVSSAVPVGQIIAGDWRMAVLWDREQASIQVSDSHADFFIRNLVAILAELRAAFGVIRPAAFCIIDATA